MKANRRNIAAWSTAALWLIPALFLGVFFFNPLIKIISVSNIFSESFLITTQELVAVIRPLTFTVAQAIISTLSTLCIGIPGAYVLSHFHFPGRNIVRAALIVPFILPTVVVASSFNSLLGPHGILNTILMTIFHLQNPPISLLNTIWAIILGHVFYNTSIVILVLGEAWTKLNPHLESSARILGANRFKTALQITLPLLTPSLLASSLLIFIFDFTSFGVILLLGGPSFATLEVEIFIQATQMLNFRLATILSLIQILMTLCFAILYLKINRGRILEITPHFRQGVSISKASVIEKFFAINILILLSFIFFSPLAALFIRSFTTIQPAESATSSHTIQATLSYYFELFVNPRGSLFYVPPIEAIFNSLLFAGLTTILALPLGLLLVIALRQPFRINRYLNPIILLPLGTSAVTLGLGLILAFNTTVLYNIPFPILLPIAHGLVALPMVVRIIQPAAESIPINLIHSARLLGANRWGVFHRVELPLLKNALIISAMFSFSISLGEFGATMFLYRPEYPTIPIAIYRFLSQPGQLNYGQAMAMSTILMILCILNILGIQLMAKSQIEEK